MKNTKNDSFEFKDQGFNKLMEAFTKNLPYAKVGVLGSKASRTEGELNNAEIGLKHEFGVGVPERSWLRMPIFTRFRSTLQVQFKEINKEFVKAAVENKLFEFTRKIGIVGEEVVRSSFDSGGFGTWPPWAPGYENNTGQILVDTTQLRDSVSSEVVKK